MMELEPGGGGVVMASFAADGPEYCSGLAVARYSGPGLMEMLGQDFTVVAMRRKIHSTPAGGSQPFTWIAAKMAAKGYVPPVAPSGKSAKDERNA